MSESRYYMVRAMYQAPEDFEIFFSHNVVAVGWSSVDFAGIASPDAAVKAVVRAYYPGNRHSPQVVGKRKNEVWRFKQIQSGDRLVVPYWDTIALATAGDEQLYQPKGTKAWERDLANQRRVDYLRAGDKLVRVPRSRLSEGLQRRLRVRGSTVADLSDFATELKALFEDPDMTWMIRLAGEEQKQASQFKQKLLQRIQNGGTMLQAGGRGLELLVGELLRREGYHVTHLATRTFPQFADADLVATRSDRFSEGKLLVQVKHHQGETDSWGVDQLKNVLKHRKDAYLDPTLILVSSAAASDELQNRCKEEGVELVTGIELMDWIYDHLPRLSPETRATLGITQVPLLACRQYSLCVSAPQPADHRQ